MRDRTLLGTIGISLLAVGAVLLNVRCGEFLVLHHLFSHHVSLDTTEQPTSGPAQEDDSDGGFSEGQLQPIVTTLPCETPPEPQPPPPEPACSKADLNEDGAVDGLDIQVLIDCLLE